MNVVEVMVSANWHIFQVLTKRSGRLWGLLNTKLKFVADHSHIWWGVSVENKRHGLPRIEHLRRSNHVIRFLSIEPLIQDLGDLDLEGIDWVIVGGESGPGARVMKSAWVRSIRDQCQAAGVPFFFKQWGGVQKKKYGRELDGQKYDELPDVLVCDPPAFHDRETLIRKHEFSLQVSDQKIFEFSN